jgi:internalin A
MGLSALPPEIGQLSELTKVIVDQNPLSTVPSTIVKCQKLRKLSLDFTSVRELPPELCDLTELTHLLVRGCKHLGVPNEIALIGSASIWGEPNAQQVLDYYFSRKEQGERPLNEVKLLLVGRGEAGKTCVSRGLRGLGFEKGHKETPGIEIHPWELACPDADPIKVHLWDFAGQEITHETHRFFLTERSL